MSSATPLQQSKLRAFDLARTTRRGRRSLEERLHRLRTRAFLIAQIAVTAGLAWFLATQLFAHSQPFFAPIAAIVCLGGTFGHRLRRGVEIAIGVAVGIAVGDVFVLAFGTGTWQVFVVVALAMSLATFLGAGQLMITQAGVQSIVVTILLPNPDQGLYRWLDALVGCAVALVVATVAPSSPVRKPAELGAQILRELAGTLRAAADALRSADEQAADAVLDRARATETQLQALADAVDEGVSVVRHSPFRLRQRPAVEAYADLLDPLDHACRNLRVLARRAVVSVWRDQAVPDGYLDLLSRLADTVSAMADDLDDGRLCDPHRDDLVAVARASAHLPLPHALSTVVILAQARSIIVDLLELTGMAEDEARELVPDVD